MAMKREAVDNEEVFISAQISGMSCIVQLSKLVDQSIHLSMEGFLIWAPKKSEHFTLTRADMNLSYPLVAPPSMKPHIHVLLEAYMHFVSKP